MFKRIDQSPALARFFSSFTATMSKNRGLPVVIGILFILISFVVQAIDVVAVSPVLELVGVITLHAGLLLGLIGLLLSEPIGR